MSRPLPSIAPPPRRLPPLPVTAHTLSNGLRVVVVERRELPLVALELVFASGAEQDEPAQAGRTSMMAEMIDEGTPSRSALEIAEQIDFLGADLGVHAGWDAVTLALEVATPRLPPALDIVADCVVDAAFPADEFERQRRERLSTLLLESDEPGVVATRALVAGVFGATHPFGAPLRGTRESVAALRLADVQDLFHRRCHAGNAFMIVVGDVAAGAINEALEARFGSWRRYAREAATPAPAAGATRRGVLLVDRPGAAQAELRVGCAAPPRDSADYFTLVVLNTILGGSFTSRLNGILRERMGVTYGVHSRFRLRRHGGLFSIAAAVETEAVARSVEVVMRELERLREEPVGADELARAQNYVALGLPRRFERNEGVAAALREQMLYDLPADHWQTFGERVFAVTAQDVAAAAARHLQPAECVVAIAAAAAQVRPALEAAGLGAITTTDVAA